MKKNLNPEAPVVVASSMDIGYALHLLSKTAPYGEWPVRRMERFLIAAIRAQQLRVYCDASGSPIACAAWAFVDEKHDRKLRQADFDIPPGSWQSGNIPWVTLFAAPFGHARAVIKNLQTSVFAECDSVSWRRFSHGRASKSRVYTWCNPSPHEIRDDEKHTAGRVIAECWGRAVGIGRFEDGSAGLGDAISAEDKYFADWLAPRESDRIVDLGSRGGQMAWRLHSDYGCGVAGIEKKGWLVDQGHNHVRDKPRVEFSLSDPGCLPHETAAFDGAISLDWLNFAPDLGAFAGEMARVLRPGATAVVGAYQVASTEDASDSLKEAVMAPTLQSEEELDHDLAEAGFEIVETEDVTPHLIRTYELVLGNIARKYDPPTRGSRIASNRIETALKAARCGALSRRNLKLRRRQNVQLAAPPPVRTPKTTLVMLSGGVDSVYVLHELLRTTDDHILAHHVNFINDERRHVIESERCRKIVAFLRENVRDFSYSETSIDHRQLRFFGYDMVAVGFEAGCVAHNHASRSNRSVDRWTIGHCSEEAGWSSRFTRVEACVAATSYPQKAPEFFQIPVVSKQEEIDAIPEELTALCWGCRRPILTEAGYKPCGTCRTCGILDRTTYSSASIAAE